MVKGEHSQEVNNGSVKFETSLNSKMELPIFFGATFL